MIVVGERRYNKEFFESERFGCARLNMTDLFCFKGRAMEVWKENHDTLDINHMGEEKHLWGIYGYDKNNRFSWVDYAETEEEAERVVAFLLECVISEKVSGKGMVCYLPSKRIRGFDEFSMM